MKKILFILIAIMSIFLINAENLQNLSGINDIINRGYIRAGIYEVDTPPFFYKGSDNNYHGMDIEILEDICSKLNIKYELIFSPSFDNVIQNLVERKTDIAISNLSITLNRAKKVFYTKPYVKLKMGLFINHRFTHLFENKRGELNYLSKNVKIGVLSNSSYEFFAKELFTQAEIIPFNTWESVIDNILNEKIHAGFYDEVALERTLRLNPSISINLKKVLIDEKIDPIAIAVSPDNIHIHYWLEHYLDNTKIKPLDYYFDVFFKHSAIDVESETTESFLQKINKNIKIILPLIIIIIGLVIYFTKNKTSFISRIFKLMLNPYIVIAGMIAGIVYGLWIKENSPFIFGFGDLYLTLLQMCSLPIMITAIISSLGKIFRNKDAYVYIKKLLLLIFIVLLTASVSGFFGGIFGKPGGALSESAKITLGNEIKAGESFTKENTVNISSLITRLIPSNIFSALSEGDILGVLIFSILLGLALGFVNLDSSKEIFSVLDALFNSFLKIINWSMYFLPVALFSLLAKQTYGMGPDIMMAMSRFVIIYHIVCIFFILILLGFLSYITKNKISAIISKLKNAILVAFGTSNSYAAMPLAIESIENSFERDKEATNLIMPLGTTVCKPGTIINLALGTVFIAQLFDVSLFANFNYIIVIFGVILSGLAASGAPGAIEISMLSIFFPIIGLPMGVAYTLLLAVNSITDPVRTMLNILTNSTITIFIAPEKK
ncbi:MAG: cation:dicarboxylase symporter family transporter [Candidatus Muiribacteriota bacterium]